MYFRQILHEERSCISYLIGCPTYGVCAVIDPQGDPQEYVDKAKLSGMKITHIIETHIHADHPSAAFQLSAVTGAPVCLGEGAAVDFPYQPFQDGQILKMGNRRIRILHMPGHTPEHICLLGDDWYLLTGDTLFVGDVGRVDLTAKENGAGNMEEHACLLYESLRRLLELPDWIEIYPGHYAGSVCGRGLDGKMISTLGRERRNNHRLNLTREQFVRFQVENLPPLPEDFRRIKEMNSGRG